MKNRLLAAGALLLASLSCANADAINNLTIGVLANPVPQSLSNPCIICGTTAGQQPADFGYNNFSSNGNLSSYNMFSTNILGGGVLANGDQIDAIPYSGALLRGLEAGGGHFGVAIDINTATGNPGGNQETLTAFQLIDLSLPAGQRVIFDFTGALMLPNIRNGNGMGDYLISGFDLAAAGVQPGDNLIFHAAWNNATDGAESFYLVPLAAPVPSPVVGAGLPGLLVGGLALLFLNRRRRQAAA